METINSAGAFICFAILVTISFKQGNGVSAQNTAELLSSANSISSSFSTDTSVTLDLKSTERTKSDSGIGNNMQSSTAVTGIGDNMQSSTAVTGIGDNMQSTTVTSTSISKSSEMSLESTSTTVTMESTTVLPSTSSISTSRTSMRAEISTTTKSAESTTESNTEEFHVIMIVMIVVLAFIIVFSVLCGVLTLCGIDIGCPLPCCGSGGSNKKSHSGIPLKMSSKKSRNFSSQHLNEAAEEFHELDFGPSIKISEPAIHYNESYDAYEEEASPSYASSKITLSQEEPISVNL